MKGSVDVDIVPDLDLEVKEKSGMGIVLVRVGEKGGRCIEKGKVVLARIRYLCKGDEKGR